MAIADIDSIIYAYLKTCTTLTALIGGADPRIYCPRLPEKAVLPAVSFFSRGGLSTPYIPGIVTPSIQFDCWAKDIVGGLTGSKAARQVYRALYDNLQGIQNVYVRSIVVGTDGKTYRCILAHTSAAADKPITGANYATYWTVAGGVAGSAWAAGTAYAVTCQIMSAIEEVQGMDLVDIDVPGYFRTLTFFAIMIRADT